MNKNINIKRLVITSGEPAGIGPDLVIELAQHSWQVELIVIADRGLLKQRAMQLKLPLNIIEYNSELRPKANKEGELKLIHIAVAEEVVVGVLNVKNSNYVLELLIRAVKGCMSKEFSAMVTAPVHKEIINESGIDFTGHTEFLAKQTNTEQVVMMLATDGLRVPLVTTHLPLKNVSESISYEKIISVIRTLNYSLVHQFKIKSPLIYVAGLNPHAGEGGYLGKEEQEIISPALKTLTEEGIRLIGPLPADTLFTPEIIKKSDAILTMYHDQGLPVLKHIGFGKAVNITLGLPFMRTSVDHGTAIDIAGKAIANANSFRYAIEIAT